jgi:WD40 repeat protein
MTFETNPYKNAILNKTFKGHMMSISAVDMHPKKSIVATASDDFTWKIWTVPNGDLIMSGEGHKDW